MRDIHAAVTLGSQVAGYRVESYVARGGMAVVYRAQDVRLGRRVALKLIAPELAQNEQFRQRFMRESQLAASIDHPNIIPIYEAGEADGLLYIAMRFVEGEDLSNVLEREGSLLPDEISVLFGQVARALDAAHSVGLVHRDVKPANMLLVGGRGGRGDQHVYLTDFGLTKKSSSLTGFTSVGHFIGTIQYVAPEQISNRPVDARTDVYSFGCVVYEALTGFPPFVRDDDAAMLWAHLSEAPPSVRAHRPDLPAELDYVFCRALAKEPAERTASCGEFMDQLTELLPRYDAQPTDSSTDRATHRQPGGSGSRTTVGSAAGSTRPPGLSTPQAPLGTGSLQVAAQQLRPSPQQRPLLLGAAAVLVVGLLAVGAFLLHNRVDNSFVRYDGRHDYASFTVEHPRIWREHTHDGFFLVLGPPEADLQKLFSDKNWDVARPLYSSHPEQLTGLYGSTETFVVDLTDPTAVKDLVTTLVPARSGDFRLAPASVDGQRAVQVDGSLKDPTSPTALTIRAYVVREDSASSTTVLMFFAPPGRFMAEQPTFRRVLQSVHLATTAR